MKQNVSFLVLFSIWISFFAPILSAQNSNTNSVFQIAKNRPNEPEKEKKGLRFRVREGKPEAVAKLKPTPVSTSNLTEAQTDSILKRLAPLPAEEKADFKLSADGPPPPKTGRILNANFPADENQPPPNVQNSKTLEVLRYTPSGAVGVTPEIAVTFSQPMVTITSQEEAAQNVPVRITPEIKGKWRWLGTRVLLFDAEKRLPMATQFTATIPAGTRSATGGTLPKDFSWTFSTNPPKVESFSENETTVKRDQFLFAAFDQEINPSDVLTKITLTANGQKIPLRLLTENEMKQEIAEIKKDKPEMLKRFIGFRAVELLPSDSTINVTFEKGLPSAEGNLTMTEAKSFSFKTFGTFKFVKASCGYNQPLTKCPSDYNWTLEFNNPLDPKNFDKSQIIISPKLDVNFQFYGNNLSITADIKPRTIYTITISKNLKDGFGQILGQDVSTKFTIGGREPNLQAQHYNDFITLDPNTKPTFSVTTTNYSALKVKIYAVKPEDYSAFLKFKDDEKAVYPTFGKLAFDKIIKIRNIPDESVETPISLAPALAGNVGHAVLVVEPPIKTKNDEPIIKWLQATQIGLDAFADHEQLAVYASNLKDGKPLGNVQLWLSNSATGTSQANGIGNIKLLPKKDKKPVYLVARNGDDSAILTDREYYDYEDEAGWSASPQKDDLRWFVFDDRKIYRPGETVSVKGYLRKVTGGKLSDISELADAASGVSYVVRDARNNEFAKGTAKLNAFGAFDFQLKIPENINLGNQRIEFKAVSKLGENEFSHYFQAQEFRRPEFEVETSVESAAPFYLGDSATLVTEAKYFSGGGLPNAEADWDISAEPTNYTPPNRDDFTFGKFEPWWRDSYNYRNYELRSSEDFKGKTDIEGKHRVALDFLKADPARPYSIEARTNIQDVNRQTFRGSTTLLVHPSKLYVGLKTPKTFVQAGEFFKVETITTDIDGKAVEGAPVSVTAELKDWQQEKGEWKEVVVDTQKCQLKSANDVVKCDFTAKQGGTYTITGRVLDEKERPNESELDVWVAGGNRNKSETVDEDKVDLIPNKKQYAPNETAEILLNAPFSPAEGVMTLERGGIVKTERFSLEKSSTVLKIPIEESYLPNVHVQVTLLGATLYDENDAKSPKIPAYATGELNLEISTESRKLNVTAEPVDKVLQPGGQTKVNVAVTDNYGKAAANTEVALVAVDESVLALTGYKIDNPLDIFYQQFEAGTDSKHSREDVMINGFGYASGGGMGMGSSSTNSVYLARTDEPVLTSRMETKGAYANSANAAANVAVSVKRVKVAPGVLNNSAVSVDGFASEAPSKSESLPLMQLRRNFAATAIFAPSVKTDANGKATVDLKLPDNLTRYRITAVAVTKSKQFGLGESNVTAKQPLMIRPSAPRFLNFGDKAELPVVVQNQTDEPMTIDVAIRSSNATLTEGNGKKVTVPANDRAEIRFPVTAENAGIARFQIGASSGKFADAAEIEFPVYTPATTEAFATYGTTDQNGAIVQPVSAPKDVYTQFGGLEITTSSTQLQELTDAFIYLQNYPFECSEQISSRILSVAALRDVLTAFNAKDMPSKSAIEAKMKSDIERLQKLQHSDGGFSFWRSDDESFPFVTIHVANALARAKAKGYEVPKEVLSKVLAYLKAIESKMAKFKYSQESQWAISAYTLYVRDLLGDRDAVKAQIILKSAPLEKFSPETLGWFLSIFANDKSYAVQAETIQKHLLNRVTETADKAHFISNYSDGEYVLLNSSRRADGVILEAFLKIQDSKSKIQNPDDDLIPKLVRGLLANRTKGRWSSTQENAFVLLALDKYFQTYEKATPNFVSKIWLGNSFAGEQKFVGHTTDSNLINVPMNYLRTSNSAQNLILDKQGEGRLYYRIGLKYAPKNLKSASADYGFEVTRTYEAVDKPEDVRRNSDGSWTIRAGARVRVKVQMVNNSTRYHVALVDNLPAGFEIINPELRNSSTTGDEPPNFWNWFEHQNLRDNRAEAFKSYLYSGVWEYKYVVRATTIGNFVAAPAKAEEMYSPETFGRSGTDFIKVE
jgi:uncharacterized protein YfaS (alpha-2-macroglobulin family)